MDRQAATAHRVSLNERAYDQARQLISAGKAVLDDRDAWSEHQPSSQAENEFIRDHGWDEYARWFLGINEEAADQTKERYEFPYGDFEKVHRCGLLSAESRAAQYKHGDIQAAAAHLHGLIDGMMQARR
jgi:hypothetical protein